MDVETGRRAHGPGDEQQRIARQERKDDEASLGEDDGEQDREDPVPIDVDELSEIEREQRVNEIRDQVITLSTFVFFSGRTRFSRDTPSHITRAAMTSADE